MLHREGTTNRTCYFTQDVPASLLYHSVSPFDDVDIAGLMDSISPELYIRNHSGLSP
jgi:hypothetical protein